MIKRNNRLLIALLLSGLISVSSLSYNKVQELNEDLAKAKSGEGQLQAEVIEWQSAYHKMEELNKANEKVVDDYSSTIKDLQEQLKTLQEVIDEMNKSVTFNDGDVRITSGATEYHLRKALSGTELYSLASAFVQAEKEYNINAYFIAGIVALESNWGRSERAMNGSNNLTGYAVYDDYSTGTYFSSKEECVLRTARLIAEDYINPNGIYHQNGYSTYHINIKYSADEDWCYKVSDIAYTLVEKSNK